MSSYIIDITNTSGDTGSVIADGGFSYTDNLNSMNEGNFIFSGSGELRRSLIEPGSQIKVYRNGTLEFHGLVDDSEYYGGGAMNIHASGYEIWLAKENGAYAGSPYSATASATIFSAVIGESNYFTAGTVNAGTNIDFRAEKSDSLMNVIKNLRRKTTQDYQIDYTNLEVDILDHRGSSTSVETLNKGIQMGDIRVSKGYPIGNKITVYGQGEGQTRIQSQSACGQDGTSQSTYGILSYIIQDRTIISQAEADLLAEAEVARLKDPRKIYEFDVYNPNKDWIAGDVITINAPSQEVSNEEVRVVGIRRGILNDEEFLEVEVTNKGYSEKTKTRNEIISEIEKNFRDANSYDQFESEYSNRTCEPTCVGGCIKVDNIGQLYDVNSIYGQCGCEFYIFSRCDSSMTLNVSNQGSSPQICLLGGQTNFGGNKAVNLANPSTNQDAATKCYVDACAGGGSLWADGANPYIVPCNSCSICVTISSSTCACASRKFRLPVGVNCY